MDQISDNKPKRKWVKKPSPSPFAYSISLPFGMKLDVKNTANAWWNDQEKLRKLVEAFGFGSTISEACAYSGISVKQYKYFVIIHPDFTEAREKLILNPILKARFSVVNGLAKDPKLAMKWLARKRPGEFGSPSRQKRAKNKKKRR